MIEVTQNVGANDGTVKNFIRLEKFKRIRDSVLLDEPERINYIVGGNGSGKTSVLSGILSFSDPYFCREFLDTDGIVEYLALNKHVAIGITPDGPYLDGKLNVGTFLLQKDAHSDHADRNIHRISFNYNLTELGEIEADQAFSHITDTAKLLGSGEIKVHRPNGPFSNLITYVQDGKTINLKRLADGVKTTIELTNFLNAIHYQLDSEKVRTYDRIHIILEEPENSLHPNYQKRVPMIFAKFFDSLDEYNADRIRVFVSTHSPFIIGEASKMPNQKTYLVDDGKLVNYDYKDHKTYYSEKSKGFSGPNCAWVVSKMLGAGLTDMGYPENYCIVEESSIMQILNHSRDRGFLKNVMFVSAGGEAKVLAFNERFKNLVTQDRLIRCNPYYYDRYFIIVDSTQGFTQVQKEKFKELSTFLGERYFELSKGSIEEYYLNIDAELYTKYKEEERQEVDKSKHGLIKHKYALEIVDRIATREDFSRLFENELDFLLA